MRPHRCDERCVCPLDGLPLVYSPTFDQHACQDPECPNAHGVQIGSTPIWGLR